MQVSITIKNTGTDAWTQAGGFKLGSQNPQDNMIWGLGRVELAVGETIPVGGSKTFVFKVTAPAAAGIYNFQWKMLRENVTWFGNPTPNYQIKVI